MKTHHSIVGMAACFTLMLSACTTDSSQPQAATPSSVASTTPATPTSIQVGDFVSTGETITDAYGTYAKVSIDPSAPAMKHNPELQTGDATLFTDEEVEKAQTFVVRFLAEQTFDSSALEGGKDARADWVSTNADRYIFDVFRDVIIADTMADEPGTLILQSEKRLPVLVRDGGPRMTDADINLTEVHSFTEEGLTGVNFFFNSTVDYRSSDSNTFDFLRKANPELSDEEILLNTEVIRDGIGENVIRSTTRYRYAAYQAENGEWRIGGFHQIEGSSRFVR